jgi:hypothetical protein
MITNSKVCYLCGKPGAGTRDHLPPKTFLEHGNYKRSSRITYQPTKSATKSFLATRNTYAIFLAQPRNSSDYLAYKLSSKKQTNPASALRVSSVDKTS